jgi:pimeloyl-ACP methyl ester carboxylesterase
MIASETGGRGAERYRGRSAVYGSDLDAAVTKAMQRLLDLGGIAPESRRCTVGDVTLHYLEIGTGEPLVLLHGAGGGAANWYRMMGPLAAHHRVIAVDLPGFGLSDSVEPQAPLGKQVAALIAELLVQIDVTPAHIAGTSFGGLTAARLAQLTNPRSLVLIDSAGLWPEGSFKMKAACNPVFQRLALKQTRSGARWTLHHVMIRRRLPAEHEDALIDYIYTTAARTDMKALGRAYAAFGGWRGQAEVITAEELGELADRTLVIWGEEDRFLPAPRARRAAALAAGVQLRMIPGVGHSPNWEAPEEVLAMMSSFWSGSGSGSGSGKGI